MKTEQRSIIENIALVFQNFAERECKGVSPLYYQLAQAISKEETLLQLSLNRRARQPIPNLLLGAVHYLLIKNPAEELAQFYPSISKKMSKNIPIELFKAFCYKWEKEIIQILKSKIVQTNAINRTAYLMPIVSSLFGNNEIVNLVDIGTSSGLSLNFDKYHYEYLPGGQFGAGNVRVKSNILEGLLPDFKKIKTVNRRIGIDQNPLDLKEGDNAIWLKALIWPDQVLRFERMEAATDLAISSPIELVQANNIEGFKKIINPLPEAEALLIYHTHVLYQFNQEERATFRAYIDELGKKRNLFYLAVEASSVFDRSDYLQKGGLIELNQYQNGNKSNKIIGITNGHANWIRWQ